MIRFLLKGLVRDRHRSFFPVLIVMIGVTLTVLIHCWVTGVMGDTIETNARFSTGHVKIMSRAYAENEDQVPNDLALTDVGELLDELGRQFPNVTWGRRIRFGGLVDVPDERGETRSQGPAMGISIDLLSPHSSEAQRLGIADAVVRGRLPEQAGEVLISDEFAVKLDAHPGDTVTLIGSTMHGSMAMQNFSVAGTVRFGVAGMDRGAMVMDLVDAEQALDMQDAAGEILGFVGESGYDNVQAQEVAEAFTSRFTKPDDEFTPVIRTLRQQNDLGSLLDYVERMIGMMVGVFVLAMAIVLWNAGLLGGVRRYGEIGVRLAIGEGKHTVYGAMLLESVMIGLVGSLAGTAIGLGIAYILQAKGFDYGAMMKNASMMAPTVIRARITSPAFIIGFVPGLFATVLGTALSGVGIYRRKTSQLFKELEA